MLQYIGHEHYSDRSRVQQREIIRRGPEQQANQSIDHQTGRKHTVEKVATVTSNNKNNVSYFKYL